MNKTSTNVSVDTTIKTKTLSQALTVMFKGRMKSEWGRIKSHGYELSFVAGVLGSSYLYSVVYNIGFLIPFLTYSLLSVSALLIYLVAIDLKCFFGKLMNKESLSFPQALFKTLKEKLESVLMISLIAVAALAVGVVPPTTFVYFMMDDPGLEVYSDFTFAFAFGFIITFCICVYAIKYWRKLSVKVTEIMEGEVSNEV